MRLDMAPRAARCPLRPRAARGSVHRPLAGLRGPLRIWPANVVRPRAGRSWHQGGRCVCACALPCKSRAEAAFGVLRKGPVCGYCCGVGSVCVVM